MSDSILFITTVYRTGEKVYPIIPALSEKFGVDVLNLYQMSNVNEWSGDMDVRQPFYDMAEKYGREVLYGPRWTSDTDANAEVYKKFIRKFKRIFFARKQSLAFN